MNIILESNPKHAEKLYEVIDFDRAHLSNLVWAATVTLEQVRKHLENGNVFVILVNGHPAGCFEFRDKPNGWVQVGYWVGKQFSGMGVAKKAIVEAMKIPCVGEHLYACVREKNTKSQSVLLHGGFRIFECVDGWFRLTRIIGGEVGAAASIPYPESKW